MHCFLILLCSLPFLLWSVNCSDEEVKPLLLFEATREGNQEVTKWLLDHGADINVRDSAGKTPLMRLVERNDTMEMLKFVVKSGADLDVADNEGKTALLSAAINGKSQQFLYLIDNKANFNVRDKRGRTALHLAADNERCTLLENFGGRLTDVLNSTDHWGRTPIWYAANRGNDKCYTALKKLGSQVDSKTLVASVNGGNLDIVNNILSIEKNVNAKNESGLSLLQIACDKKHSLVAKYLIVNGADINIRDQEQKNILHICSASGSEDVVSILLSRGFDIHSKDVEGNTPLHYAAINDEPKVLSSLKEKGGNFRERNKADKTPVELAVENNSLEALTWFIKNGYEIDELSSSKKTLCHVAAETGSIPALKLLIKMGADCNKSGESANRPIHYAVNYIESLKTLLSAGVEVDAPGAEGKTALEVAVDSSNKNAASCLLKYGAKPDQVRDIPRIDQRYYAYVSNPDISTRMDIMKLIKDVKNGVIKTEMIDC